MTHHLVPGYSNSLLIKNILGKISSDLLRSFTKYLFLRILISPKNKKILQDLVLEIKLF